MSNLELWRRSLTPWTDLDSVFDNFFKSEVPDTWSRGMKKAMAAKAELSETPSAFVMKFEIPGLKREDIKVDLNDNRLTVSGERREEKKEEKDHKVHYSELSYGSFMRSYTFPVAVDPERVEASYDGGILTVQVAKAPASKSARQISVK